MAGLNRDTQESQGKGMKETEGGSIPKTKAVQTSDNIVRLGVGRAHLPILDVLRGTAIIGVLFEHFSMPAAHHAGVAGFMAKWFAAGGTGVDLFFVLSGFLITGILLEARNEVHFFRNFYARRFLRIFPLYYGVLAFILIGLSVAPFLLHAGSPVLKQVHDAWGGQPWLWTYTTNIAQALGVGGFQSTHHFWTLAVEEQFYMVWPLGVFLFPRRLLIWVCVGLIAVAWCFRVFFQASHPGSFAVYVLTPCRIDGLAIGSLLACAMESGWILRLVGPAKIVLPVTAAAIFLRVVHVPPGLAWAMLHSTFYSMVVLFFGAVMVLALTRAQNARPLGKAGRFLATVGRYSYGIYVIHGVLFFAYRKVLPWDRVAAGLHAPAIAVLLYIAIGFLWSFGLAYASWHLYEKHFLKLKRYFPQARSFTTTLAKLPE